MQILVINLLAMLLANVRKMLSVFLLVCRCLGQFYRAAEKYATTL